VVPLHGTNPSRYVPCGVIEVRGSEPISIEDETTLAQYFPKWSIRPSPQSLPAGQRRLERLIEQNRLGLIETIVHELLQSQREPGSCIEHRVRINFAQLKPIRGVPQSDHIPSAGV